MKEIVSTANAPAAIGPYSQATKFKDVVYVSGQLPIDPSTGTLSQEDICSQTKLVMTNISNILKAAGSSLDKILMTTILVADLGDFGAINEAYGSFFEKDPPARACYQVAALPKNAAIEVAVVAAVND